MITLLATLHAAHALPPDREVRLWEVGEASAGAVERMAITEDRGLVVGRTRGTQQAWLLDVDRWELVTFSGIGSPDACAVNGVAAVQLQDGSYEIWLACASGKIVGHGWDGENLYEVFDGDERLVFDVDTQLSGLWYEPQGGLFYGVSLTGTNGQAVVHVIDTAGAGAVDDQLFSSYPTALPAIGFIEGAIVQDGYLVVSHGAQDMTYLQLGLDGAVGARNTTSMFHCLDLAPGPFIGVYCVDHLGRVGEYWPLGDGFQALGVGELDAPKAVTGSLDLTDGWLAITGDRVEVWEMDENGDITSATPYFQGPPDADNPIQDMVNADGYLFGGGEGGGLHVVTARPWVDPDSISVTPGAATSGDTVTVTFTVDTDADWVLNLGGDRTGKGGRRLESGSALAGAPVVVALEVDGTYAEGDNALFVIATDPATLLTGHGRGSVVVDDPPDPPTLTDANLRFGDGELTLSFDGIADEDLAHYDVYVTQAPFSPADYPTGGPAWDGPTGLVTPVQVKATGGQHVTQRIGPLENEVTYYVAVRAWDQGGKEGPMSRVVKGTPSRVLSASEAVGDRGGTPCSTGPRPGAWLGLVGALALAGRSRRRRGALAAALAALLLVAPAARAQEEPQQEEDHWWRQDTTPTRANFEIRYGTVSLVDQELERYYDLKPHDIVYLEVGPQFFHVLEIDFGFGFMQDLAFGRSDDDQISGQRIMMTWWPLALDGTLRAHFVDEQPVVPFVRYGWDYVLWSEKKDVGLEKATTAGGKFGTHTALGVNVLLDIFQPGRASFLETQTGINDSWITVEWRRQRVDARERPWDGRTQAKNALDFSGDSVTIGLKLDW